MLHEKLTTPDKNNIVILHYIVDFDTKSMHLNSNRSMTFKKTAVAHYITIYSMGFTMLISYSIFQNCSSINWLNHKRKKLRSRQSLVTLVNTVSVDSNTAILLLITVLQLEVGWLAFNGTLSTHHWIVILITNNGACDCQDYDFKVIFIHNCIFFSN